MEKNTTTVAKWMQQTDLVEVSYRKGSDKFCFGKDDAPQVPSSNLGACSLTPVTASEVGLFRCAPVGKTNSIEKGAEVQKGQTLGLIETAGEAVKVNAPAGGTIISALIEEGQPVEYGQPLFFIQPRN
jgi:biotin carboxyl carrier protein